MNDLTMEIVNKAFNEAKKNPTAYMSDEQKRCDLLNNDIGKLNEADNYNCDICKNKGVIYGLVNNCLTAFDCECRAIRQSLHNINSSGLTQHKFSMFEAVENWQKELLNACKLYALTNADNWLFIGGQSGAGKTHLCSSALIEKMINSKQPALLFEWNEKSKKLKQLINEPAYESELVKYKTIPLLYIDDLFKVKKGVAVTPADINLAFELIDSRYRNNLTTIISSEFSLDEIIRFDEAVGGRIKQKSKQFALFINRSADKNYRLK